MVVKPTVTGVVLAPLLAALDVAEEVLAVGIIIRKMAEGSTNVVEALVTRVAVELDKLRAAADQLSCLHLAAARVPGNLQLALGDNFAASVDRSRGPLRSYGKVEVLRHISVEFLDYFDGQIFTVGAPLEDSIAELAVSSREL